MALSSKLSIDGVDFKGKRVLVRVDFNVPLDKDKNVRDPKRIAATIPTLKYILDHGAKSLILMSHLGRPDGFPNPEYSLKPVVPVLEKLLGKKVTFVDNAVGSEAEKITANPPEGSVILLENLRFHLAEEGKGVKEGKKVKATKEEVEEFRKKLSKYGDVFVNDAFGTAHRAHSSMVGVKLPIRASGFLMKAELHGFAKILENPQRPFVAILGGAKVEDKILLINNLLEKVDEMIIGGAMAFTFLKVLYDTKIGKSLFDEKGAKLVPEIMKKAEERKVKIHLPVDFRCGDNFKNPTKIKETDRKTGVPDDWLGMDCGPKTIAENAGVVLRAKSIMFNGPQGVFENPLFSAGTITILEAVAAATKLGGAVSVVGGGDSASAASKFGFAKYLTHVSTGGGAGLELLEGKELPGIKALSDKVKSKL